VTHMRTEVEVDLNMGLLGFEVIEQLRQEYAWAIDLQLCVFLQGRAGRRRSPPRPIRLTAQHHRKEVPFGHH